MDSRETTIFFSVITFVIAILIMCPIFYQKSFPEGFPSELSYENVWENVRESTTFRKEKFIEYNIGTSVFWNGRVMNVKRVDEKGIICVFIDKKNQKYYGRVAEAVLYLKNEELAYKLEKGKKYYFKGDIKDILSISREGYTYGIEVHLENVKIYQGNKEMI